MKLGRIIGRVIAPQREPGLDAQRLLLVQPVRASGDPTGPPQVMLDAVGAGAGELVFYVHGKEASFPFRPDRVPADRVVAGIVDQVHRASADP